MTISFTQGTESPWVASMVGGRKAAAWFAACISKISADVTQPVTMQPTQPITPKAAQPTQPTGKKGDGAVYRCRCLRCQKRAARAASNCARPSLGARATNYPRDAGGAGMFDFYRNRPSFLPVHRYVSQEQLLADLGEKVIRPAELKVLDLRAST
jgi:hypothetical protein